jgi:hydroxymethylpyrimidine/phosphomethylpyrimidine kinase
VKGRVLIVAGSDPSGGAGVQADLKTATALGAYGAAAITALTVQNTTGVFAVRQVAPEFIAAQIAAVLDDIGADAVKIGMLGDAPAARAVARTLEERAAGLPVVLDPVLVATSGDALAGAGVADVILSELAPLARVVTPNANELGALTGLPVATAAQARLAARALRARIGAAAVLAKGGHVGGDEIVDLLVTKAGETEFKNPRIDCGAIHGAGCTLATAIACGLAQGASLDAAVGRASAYVHAAIRTAPRLGAGARPLNHVDGARPQ